MPRELPCLISGVPSRQVTGRLSASSADFGTGEVVAASLNAMGGLHLTSGSSEDVQVTPGAGGQLKLHSDLWMGATVLRVGDLIHVNGSGTIVAGNLEVDAVRSSIRSVAGDITMTPADKVLVQQTGGSADVMLQGASAQLILEGTTESFLLRTTAAGQLALAGTNPDSGL